jgi:hypothetical protein
MRTLFGFVVVLTSLVGMTRAGDGPKKSTLENDQKALQGEWKLVPGKGREDLALPLVFDNKSLTIETKRPGVQGSNSMGFSKGKSP